jgi:hypothetical protein
VLVGCQGFDVGLECFVDDDVHGRPGAGGRRMRGADSRKGGRRLPRPGGQQAAAALG